MRDMGRAILVCGWSRAKRYSVYMLKKLRDSFVAYVNYSYGGYIMRLGSAKVPILPATIEIGPAKNTKQSSIECND